MHIVKPLNNKIMSSIKTKLNDFRYNVKEEICLLLKDFYLELHINHPNFEEGEEYVLERYNFAEDKLFVNVAVWNTYDEYSYNELQEVHRCIVTLDNNLFFICGEYENETEWNEFSTDELVEIYEFIVKNIGGN